MSLITLESIWLVLKSSPYALMEKLKKSMAYQRTKGIVEMAVTLRGVAGQKQAPWGNTLLPLFGNSCACKKYGRQRDHLPRKTGSQATLMCGYGKSKETTKVSAEQDESRKWMEHQSMKQAALILALLGIPLFVVGSIWMFSGKPILRKIGRASCRERG